MDYPQRIVVGLCVLGVAVGAWLGSRPDPAPASVQSAEATELAESPAVVLEIHVSGEVVTPGVVVVAAGSMVADVISAAGGARMGARLDLLNLSRPVVDGEHLAVLGPDGVLANAESTGDGLVRINQASASELESLPGVGPVLAARIVAYRDSVGPFEEAEDLLDVSGIGEAKLASLRDFIALP
jgi:competence protein ComEA